MKLFEALSLGQTGGFEAHLIYYAKIKGLLACLVYCSTIA